MASEIAALSQIGVVVMHLKLRLKVVTARDDFWSQTSHTWMVVRTSRWSNNKQNPNMKELQVSKE